MPDDLQWMTAALAEAARAPEHRDVPIGAVVVHEGRIIGRSHNHRELDADPTAHAEVLALREAGAARGSWRLDDATLFVTLEPCAMCAAAIVHSRLARVVFAAPDPKAGAIVSLFELCDDERLNHKVPWTANVARTESEELLRSFFASRR